MNSYGSSVGQAVAAWRAATQTYTEVFEALASEAAKQSRDGRQSSETHLAFREMARTARAALDATEYFALWEDSQATARQTSEISKKSSEKNSHLYSEIASQTNTQGRDRLQEKKKDRRDKKLRKRVIVQANAAIEPGRQAAHHQSSDSSNQLYGESRSHSTRPQNTVPILEYEDVSAEVEARLRAKDEQKAATMKQKKRKRVSTDSVELMSVDRNAGRPDAKRSRLESPMQQFNDNCEARKHARDIDENVDGNSHKRIRNFQ